MFDTVKFGKALSTLRKNADMTQSEVADRLNLTHQAVSKYERGQSFPDISVLVMIADMFGITLDRLIGYGQPTCGEAEILQRVAMGERNVTAESIADVVNLAPLLKPSVLTRLSEQFKRQGVDISDVIALAEYLNDESVIGLIENATVDDMNAELLEKFIPLLDHTSKEVIFQKILDGELDWRFLRILLPYADYITTQVEAAVIFGVLPSEALDILHDQRWGKTKS